MKQLQAALRERSLPTNYRKKTQLVKRLKNAVLSTVQSETVYIDDSDTDDTDDTNNTHKMNDQPDAKAAAKIANTASGQSNANFAGEASDHGSGVSNNPGGVQVDLARGQRSEFSFRDVEESLEMFSGNGQSVAEWLNLRELSKSVSGMMCKNICMLVVYFAVQQNSQLNHQQVLKPGHC